MLSALQGASNPSDQSEEPEGVTAALGLLSLRVAGYPVAITNATELIVRSPRDSEDRPFPQSDGKRFRNARTSFRTNASSLMKMK